MFKKLLKYDFRSLSKVALIMVIVIFAIALGGSVSLRISFEAEYSYPLIASLCGLTGMFSVIGVFLAIGVFGILIIYRFYKNFYSDEGYLTFTLPVSRKTLLGEKIVFTLICEAICIVAVIIAALIYGYISPVADEGSIINPSFVNSVFRAIGDAAASEGAWFAVWVLEFVIGFLAFSAAAFILVYFCITLGAVVAKKHKLLAAIGIYYGVTFIFSAAWNIFFTIGLSSLFAGIDRYLSDLGANSSRFIIALTIFGAIMAIAAFFTVLFNVTLNKIENKLNLA